MTVKQLIELLQSQDPNMTVYCWDCGFTGEKLCPVEAVEQFDAVTRNRGKHTALKLTNTYEYNDMDGFREDR